jgi:hypothetical protein
MHKAFAKSYAKGILYQKAFWKVNNIGKEWQGSFQKSSASMPEVSSCTVEDNYRQ